MKTCCEDASGIGYSVTWSFELEKHTEKQYIIPKNQFFKAEEN